MSEKVMVESISSEAPNYNDPVEATDTPVDDTEITEAAEGTTTEAPQEEPTDVLETTKEDPISDARINEFIKREGEFIQKEQEYKRQLAEFEKYKNFQAQLSDNPLEALISMGVDIDSVVNKSLGLGEKELSPAELAEKIAEEKIQAFRLEQQQQQEAVKQAKLMDNFKGDIRSQIQANNEKYELCNLEGDQAIEDAVKVVEWELQNSGNLITIDQALDKVENHYESIAKKYAAAKKMGLQPKVQENVAVKDSTKPAKTLTTQMVSNAPRTSAVQELDVEASKKAAADLLRWN